MPKSSAMDRHFRRLREDYARQTEEFVIAKMTGRVGVGVRKPRWMPAFVWRWMWRQVVVTEERPTFSVQWPEPLIDRYEDPGAEPQ